jgi:putative restriction endonuclease
VTSQLRLEVSGRLRTDFDNGKSYYPFQGREVRAPTRDDYRPARDFILWHNEHIFLG